MTYRLTYWNKRGRGEQVRLLLSELGQPWEDAYTSGDAFQQLKKQGPSVLYFGAVPMLEDGDFRLCQGPAILGYLARKHAIAPSHPQLAAKADAIVLGAEDLRTKYFALFGPEAAQRQQQFIAGDWKSRWLFSFEGLLEQSGDSGWFVGNSLSHADIAVWDALDAILQWVQGASLAGYPRLEAFFAAVKARPAIAAYLASERRAPG